MGEVSSTRARAHGSRDLEAAEHTLANSEQRLREILGKAPVAFVSVDAEGLILDWNPEAELLFGWPRVSAIGRKLAQTVLPQPVRRAYERDFAELLATTDPQQLSRRLELTALRKDGHEFPADMTISRSRAGESYLFDVFVSDISAQQQADRDRRYAEAQLAHQALHDPLTGLPNRTLLVDRVTHALALANRQGSIAAMLSVDIDDFQLVNDSLGHHAGDELLVQIVSRLTGVLRASDTLARSGQDTLARVGGDELGLLCEALSGEHDAIHIAERIASALREPFTIAEQRVFVKVSIGIALTSTSVTPDALMRDADTAMYRAKERGGDCYELFAADTRTGLLDRVRRENDLRDAIGRGELRVFYQPIVSVLDGGVIGAEALLRWEHPQHGLLAPAEFIPLAEHTGLIIPIGRWVLKEAWAQLARWQQTPGPTAPLSVFVNVSARQLVDDDLATLVGEVLQEGAVKPSGLILEITETSLMEDTDERVAVLRQLQALGVRLALDDFGTGYSSLGSLRSLPFQCLKLDRSFVAGLDKTKADPQIAAAVIEMARALTMTVIAEGVETQAQLAYLRRVGCHFAQGYYFGAPMPANELSARLQGGSTAGQR